MFFPRKRRCKVLERRYFGAPEYGGVGLVYSVESLVAESE